MLPGTARTKTPRRALDACRVPPFALAVLEALRFDNGGSGRLEQLDDAGFAAALEFCDRAQLTLILDHLCRHALPPWVQARVRQNLRDYGVRFDRLKRSLFEIADAFDARGIEFVVLKGPAHAPDFTPDPLLRAQGDIDIWCEPDALEAARGVLLELDYRPFGPAERRHLAPMIRETDWEWRGDYFASDLPVPVELHYELWDEAAESLAIGGDAAFWERRATAQFDGRRLPVLAKPDILAFAALHLLMHLLHGDLRLQRAWEIAHFLDRHARDDAFWSAWQRSHTDALRRLEAIVFQLTAEWFGADLAEAAEDEIKRLPGDVKSWMERYALSPLEGLFRPNKNELWLHLVLVESARDRRAIFFRRLLPMKPPPRRGQSAKRRASFLGARLRHHALALVPALREGVRWIWATRGPAPGFLRFQVTSAMLSLGVFIFLLLYNLHLLESGIRENVIGRVAASMTLGSLAGAVPAAAIARRAGLARTMLAALAGGAACMVLRALSVREAWLVATAFLHGSCLSLWTVSFSPAVAALTTERNRQFAFSLACSAGVGAGIVAGLVGSRLPGPRAALFIAACIVALAAWPAARLRIPAPARAEAKTYPRGKFVGAFLACLALFSVAVGGFNPFFNAFFSKQLRMGVEQIGLAFSLAHTVQVLALLSAPLVLRRLGLVRGIAWMQLATGAFLLCLASGPSAGVAIAAYVGYVSFQYMSEPGILSMLMSRVAPGERSGASVLFFLVTSISGSLAALVAGSAVVRFGYPAVLVVCAMLAAAAALLFRAVIAEAPGKPGGSPPPPPAESGRA